MPSPRRRTQSLGTQQRWRAWSGRLWILAIVLFTLTVFSFGEMIHDRARGRQAARMLAGITAREAATATRDRLLLLGLTPASVRSLSVDSARAVAARVMPEVIASRYTLAPLDSSIVVTSNGRTLYGALHTDDRYHGTHTDSATSWKFEVDLARGAIPPALLMPVNTIAMLHNVLLLTATVIVTGLAFGSARRTAELAEARASFVAGVSHDLRMPLAQILLAGETLELRADLDAPARSRMTRSIVREAQRLMGLVENLLLFTRSGAAGLSMRRDPVDVAALVAETTESVELAARDAGQTIAASVEPGLAVLGEQALLRQALANLVDNAIKYGPSGQEIRIGATAVGDVVRITIDDRGPGIPRGERARVFDPYERLYRDQPSHRTGAGLGLSIVRDIVAASGGRVRIEDAPGGGARAVVELPSAAPAAAEVGAAR